MEGLEAALQRTEIGAQTFSKGRAVRDIARIQRADDATHRLRVHESAPDLVLNLHGRHRSAGEIKCSASLVGHG